MIDLIPLLDVDMRTRPRMQRGYKLMYVDIRDIELPHAWNRIRLDDNLSKIRATKSMPPVHLVFRRDKGKYVVEDGIHRIYAAMSLGYPRVPALVLWEKQAASGAQSSLDEAENRDRLRARDNVK